MIEHYIKIVKGINYFPKCSIKDVCQGAIMPLLTKRWISTAERLVETVDQCGGCF